MSKNNKMDIEEPKVPLVKKDASCNILIPKKAPNKLMCEEAANEDNSTVYMSAAKMQELEVLRGDPVVLTGKRRHTTVCIALEGDTIDDGKLGMSKGIRRNLRVRLGDTVIVKPGTDVPNFTKVHILPFDDSVEGLTGDLTQSYLIPYFKDAYRPLYKGDTFIVRGNFRAVEFKVVACEPKE